ncbi:MAG: hypothetical protein WD118_10510 [Phycisphaeraceae bacterium]
MFKKLSGARLWINIVLLVAALAVVPWLLWHQRGQANVAHEHNRIVEQLIDKGEYRQAAAELETLLPRAGSRLEPEVERTLATCYLRIGSDPGMSLAESAEWFARVRATAPELLETEHRRILQLYAAEE